MKITKQQKAENRRQRLEKNFKDNPLTTYQMQQRKIIQSKEVDEDFPRM